jgi:DNA-binding MarR family transcriptional regulator
VRGRGFDDDTANSVGYLLRDTSRLVLDTIAKRLNEHGITLPHYFVLRELWQKEGLTQRELAGRVRVREATMVATLDALETAGLVVRTRSTDDRRKIHIGLSEQGAALRDALLDDAAAVLEHALEGVSDASIADLRRSLKRMKKNLTAADG